MRKINNSEENVTYHILFLRSSFVVNKLQIFMHLQGLLKPQKFTEYSKMQKHMKNNQNIELPIVSNS